MSRLESAPGRAREEFRGSGLVTRATALPPTAGGTTPVAAATLDWTETDDKAVDTVRVLAMDAVQKVGNGHPGTAMSLAPAAYLLFQKVMRHNPADPHWPGRDRFVLSCGHSSLTLYLQLLPRRLGPRDRGHQVAAHLGQQDPGPPGVRPHRRGGDHHRPARARASATRSAWRWPPAASAACSTPTRPRATRPSTTTSTPCAATVTSRRASAPRPRRSPAPSGSATSP